MTVQDNDMLDPLSKSSRRGGDCISTFGPLPLFKAIELQVQQPENTASTCAARRQGRKERGRGKAETETPAIGECGTWGFINPGWQRPQHPTIHILPLPTPDPLKYACVSAMPKSSCSCSTKRNKRYE